MVAISPKSPQTLQEMEFGGDGRQRVSDVVRDIAEQERADEALRESEEG